jgi:hypothetical protein
VNSIAYFIPPFPLYFVRILNRNYTSTGSAQVAMLENFALSKEKIEALTL